MSFHAVRGDEEIRLSRPAGGVVEWEGPEMPGEILKMQI